MAASSTRFLKNFLPEVIRNLPIMVFINRSTTWYRSSIAADSAKHFELMG